MAKVGSNRGFKADLDKRKYNIYTFSFVMLR